MNTPVFCYECEHFRRVHTADDESGDIWYNQFCNEPSVQKTEINYQTGEKQVVIPFARDINPKGNCQYFKLQH